MTKMNIEIGEYVRTKYGITQYKEYETTNGNKLLCMPIKDGSNGIFVNVEDVIKSSPNIIDLIEVGDYVNGYLVMRKPYVYCDVQFVTVDTQNSWSWGEGEMPVDNINSIVTKEQFEGVKYEIK